MQETARGSNRRKRSRRAAVFAYRIREHTPPFLLNRAVLEYIEDLSSYLFSAYGVNVENINLELELDKVTLNLNTAIPCGLIINELVSNALKYAFPNGAQGMIYIALHCNEDNNYTLIIRDNGIGLPLNWEVESVNSLGFRLVDILAKQLEGTLQVNSGLGTEFTLIFSELR